MQKQFKPVVNLLHKVPAEQLGLVMALIAHTTTAIVYTSDPGNMSGGAFFFPPFVRHFTYIC
jgi:hypothetical protein